MDTKTKETLKFTFKQSMEWLDQKAKEKKLP